MSDSMAKKQLSKKGTEFWQAVEHVNQSNAPAVSAMISGVSGKHNIVNMEISL